jgi:Tol biopolymer transport system component
VNPDGSDLTVLPKAPEAFCNAWSPAGTRLLCGHAGGVITIRSSDGGGLVRLDEPPQGFQDDEPQQYSSDGSHVLFLRVNSSGQHTLYSVKTNGTGLTALSPASFDVTDLSDFAGQTTVDSSPDGSKVAFTASFPANGGTSLGLFVAKIDGTGLHKVNIPSGLDPFSAQWSPNGQWIAFSSGTTFSRVFIVHPAGSGLALVTTPKNECGSLAPMWSPNGTKLLFLQLCNRTSTAALYTVNLDGSGLSKVTDLNQGTFPFSLDYFWGTAPVG